MDDIEIEKSNMLMIGPTGSGKTYLVKTLARILDVPLAITDATSLTEAGYIGDDIESVVSKLLAAADNDVEKAEQGIIFIDEIDKIAKKENYQSAGRQRGIGTAGHAEAAGGKRRGSAGGREQQKCHGSVDHSEYQEHPLYLRRSVPGSGGYHKGAPDQQSSIGFGADLKDKYDHDKTNPFQSDYGGSAEFRYDPGILGRLPIVFTLEGMNEEMLVKILKEPKHAILKQYQKLLALDEVRLDFDEEALTAIARKAMKKDTGARALGPSLKNLCWISCMRFPRMTASGR